jgi:hypothetical protein
MRGCFTEFARWIPDDRGLMEGPREIREIHAGYPQEWEDSLDINGNTGKMKGTPEI